MLQHRASREDQANKDEIDESEDENEESETDSDEKSDKQVLTKRPIPRKKRIKKYRQRNINIGFEQKSG